MTAGLESRGETTRRRILEVLRRRGASTLQELADAVGITRMGVYQHLKALVSADLVQFEQERAGVGRPRNRYNLTPAANELFPRRYGDFANGLIGDLKQLGGEDLLDRVFLQRCSRMEAQYRDRVANKSLAERVPAVATILEENGYMADWRQVDEKTFEIREHNCAICSVAQENGIACKYELVLLSRLLQAEVRRESHMASGDELCAYRVTSAETL
jgi:predicted ArsR family transcriptional regulator